MGVSTVENSAEYHRARDEVFRRVGRNVLMFQNVEMMLKTVLSRGQFKGTLSQLAEMVTEWGKKPDKRTFGQLIDPLVDGHLTPMEELDTLPTDGDKISLSFRVTFSHTAEERAAFQSELESLVAERNRLIHLALADFRLNSIQGCMAAGADLDRQQARILPVRKKLSELVKLMLETNVEMLRRLPEIMGTRRTRAPRRAEKGR